MSTVEQTIARARRDFGASAPLPRSAFTTIAMYKVYAAAYRDVETEFKTREEYRKRLPLTVKGTELEPGDIVRVRCDGSQFADSIVEKIDGGLVTLKRPHMVTTNNVRYAGNSVLVACSVETFTAYDTTDFVLIVRQYMPFI